MNVKPVLTALWILSALAFSADAAAQSWDPSMAHAATRHVNFNGIELDANGYALLAQLEATYGGHLPNGQYWYDPVCGAIGNWGGPTLGFIMAGLPLGGALPPQASAGSTGVFINGRNLPVEDLAALQRILGPIERGRYFLDAWGNAGAEGGAPTVNILVMQQQQQQYSGAGVGSGGDRGYVGSEGAWFYNAGSGTYSDWWPGK